MSRRSVTLHVRVNGAVFACCRAELRLSDEGYDINEPQLVLDMVATPARPKVAVYIEFVRSRVRTEPPEALATGFMDTARRWTRVHHAEVRLAMQHTPCDLADEPFRLSLFDRVRIEVTRRIARIIARHRIADAFADRCVQVVEALARLNVEVEIVYGRTRPGEPPRSLDAVPDLGANARALTATVAIPPHARSVA